MLSLVLGSKITDSSVAAIVSCYANIEMLDLSGYVFCLRGMQVMHEASLWFKFWVFDVWLILTADPASVTMALEWYAMHFRRLCLGSSSLYALILPQVSTCFLPFKVLFPIVLHCEFNVCIVISLGGIQFATAQLPYLQLIDCGMSLCDFSSRNDDLEDITEIEENQWGQKSNSRTHPIYQKLIIKHGRLKKLSLWGCSGLDVYLYLNKLIHLGLPAY